MLVDKEKFGKFLRSAREERGLSQTEVADLLGFSSSQFISNWERGLSTPPLDKLKQVTIILNIKPELMVESIMNFTESEVRSLVLPKRRRSRKRA